jgi:hypothetical protein
MSGIEPRAVQPVARCYTDWATPAANNIDTSAEGFIYFNKSNFEGLKGLLHIVKVQMSRHFCRYLLEKACLEDRKWDVRIMLNQDLREEACENKGWIWLKNKQEVLGRTNRLLWYNTDRIENVAVT